MGWNTLPVPVSIDLYARDPSQMVVGRVFKMESGGILLTGDINLEAGYCGDCAERGNVVAYTDDLVPTIAEVKASAANAN